MDTDAPQADDRGSGLGWLALTLLAGLAFVSQVLVAAITVVVHGPLRMGLLQTLAGALAAWWFARGAWLRTRWGRPPEGSEAPWDEPALTTRRAGWYLHLGAACVVAAAVALAVQVLSSTR